MNENQSPNSGATGTEAPVKKASRLKTIVRAVVALAICGGVVSWMAYVVWESRYPALAAARRLKAGDSTHRLAALRELSEFGTTDSATVIPALTAALADDDARVRAAAADSLSLIAAFAIKSGSRGDEIPAAARGLFSAIKDPDADVRGAAVRALVSIGTTSTGGGGRQAAQAASAPPAAPVDSKQLATALIECLSDKDASTRLAALHGLGAIASKLGDEPPPALIAALDDQVPANQAAVITAVARFPRAHDRLMPTLTRSLADKSPREVQQAARAALSLIRPSSISAASVPSLAAALENRDADIRYEIIQLLAKLGPSAVVAIPGFIAALKESTDTDRVESRAGAPTMGNAPLTGPAYVAAEALGRIAPGTPRAAQAVAALTEIVRSGPVERRPTAASSLAKFGAEAAQAIPALAEMLRDTSPPPADISIDEGAAATALGQIAPATPSAGVAITALTAELQAKSPTRREAAAKALERFGPKAKDAIPQLRNLLNDPDPTVRSAAQSAIKSLEK